MNRLPAAFQLSQYFFSLPDISRIGQTKGIHTPVLGRFQFSFFLNCLLKQAACLSILLIGRCYQEHGVTAQDLREALDKGIILLYQFSEKTVRLLMTVQVNQRLCFMKQDCIQQHGILA